MRHLKRPPRFTFTSFEEVAFEYLRIFQLPPDVLYDFKLISQFHIDGEKLPWAVHDVTGIKAKRQQIYHRAINWRTTIDFSLDKHEEPIEIPTVGLLNEFGEVVAFKDIGIEIRPGDTYKSLNYGLAGSHDHMLHRVYS